MLMLQAAAFMPLFRVRLGSGARPLKIDRLEPEDSAAEPDRQLGEIFAAIGVDRDAAARKAPAYFQGTHTDPGGPPMCGRYALYSPADAIADLFGATAEIEDLAPRYNAAPRQWLPVIRQRPSGERVLDALRWGLLPSWAKDETIAARLINARAETLAEKPAFRAAYRARRCIVPADGFYEWAKRPDGKQPYYIHGPDGTVLAFAGLWERWTRPADGGVIDSFTIVTTEANPRIQALHDRMPVILAPEVVDVWLDPTTGPARLSALLMPFPAERLAMHPVARAVGNVHNEGQELIAAVPDAVE